MSEYDVVNFEQDVISKSHKIPVLVDFWAEWCGPCRILGPILEKYAKQSENRWLLKKVNVEEMQDVAAEYNIRGIPAVKLFRNGQPVAEFTGALPELQLQEWLKDNIPSKIDEKAEQALLFLDTGNLKKARSIFEAILKEEPNHSVSAFFLGKVLLFENPEAAESLFSISEKDPYFLDESGYFRKLSSLIKSKDRQEIFAEHAVKPVFMEGLQALAKQDFEQALARFIDVVMKYKSYENEIAREACIGIFHYLGAEHELTKKFRRRFDMALY